VAPPLGASRPILVVEVESNHQKLPVAGPARQAPGEMVAGTYRQRITLTSSRFAMIDNGLGFALVPRPVDAGARPASRPPCRRRRQGEPRDRVEFRAQARAGKSDGLFQKKT
jgi:hypothetical protein